MGQDGQGRLAPASDSPTCHRLSVPHVRTPILCGYCPAKSPPSHPALDRGDRGDCGAGTPSQLSPPACPWTPPLGCPGHEPKGPAGPFPFCFPTTCLRASWAHFFKSVLLYSEGPRPRCRSRALPSGPQRAGSVQTRPLRPRCTGDQTYTGDLPRDGLTVAELGSEWEPLGRQTGGKETIQRPPRDMAAAAPTKSGVPWTHSKATSLFAVYLVLSQGCLCNLQNITQLYLIFSDCESNRCL